MKRYHYFILIILFCISCALGYYFILGNSPEPDESTFSDVPSRLIMIGPFAKDISISENVGKYSVNMQAKMVHVKKSKFLMFSTALKKKIISQDITITIYKNGDKKLEFFKDRLALDPTMNYIEVKNPKMLFPEGMKQPRSVTIDKEHDLLTIHYPDRVDRWDLSG